MSWFSTFCHRGRRAERRNRPPWCSVRPIASRAASFKKTCSICCAPGRKIPFSIPCLLVETNLPSHLFPMGCQSSLWTKVHRIDVSRIKREQLSRLAELHNVQVSKLECDRLGELVGWNVYLCRMALFHAAVRGMSLGAVLAAYKPEQRAFSAFADHLEDLSHDLERLDATGAFSKPIGLLLKEAVDGVPLPPETAWRLMRKGVVAATKTRGQFRSRCPLYADFFRVESS